MRLCKFAGLRQFQKIRVWDKKYNMWAWAITGER